MDIPASTRSLAIDLHNEMPFTVGGVSIDPLSREAKCGHSSERLQPQTLKVFVLLARRRGAVVTREELVDHCWNGRFVGDDVINRSISQLRRVAGRVGGFEIETVSRAGYRLVELANAPQIPRRKWFALAGAGALALAGVAAVITVLQPRKQGEPLVPTVLILPLSDAATDPLLRELARSTRQSLTDKLSAAGVPVRLIDARQGADRSGADFVLSGEVGAGREKVRAEIRLEESRRHTILFSHQFEANRNEAGGLPDQIGASIATTLSWTGAMMVLDRRHPSDPSLTVELLKQFSLIIEGNDPLGAYQITRKIAPEAPNSAIAQLALAFNTGFALSSMPHDQREEAVVSGRRAADRAVALAPEFGDAYIPWCLLHSPSRIAECERHLQAGLRIDPNAPFITAFLNSLANSTGRLNDSLEFAQAAVANDPYKPSKLSRLVRALEATGRNEDANRAYAQATHFWPNYTGLAWNRFIGVVERGDPAAIEHYAMDAASGLSDSDRVAETNLFAAERSGNRHRATEACAPPGLSKQTQMLCMLGLANLGAYDPAFALAQRLYPALKGRSALTEDKLWLDAPDGPPIGILSAPGGAALRRDIRFLAVADGLGLLDYWRSGRHPDFCAPPAEEICTRLNFKH